MLFEDNGWSKFTSKQIRTIETAINALGKKCSIDEILDTFEEKNLPLLYDCPGFYGQFLADTAFNRELIEDFCFEKM